MPGVGGKGLTNALREVLYAGKLRPKRSYIIKNFMVEGLGLGFRRLDHHACSLFVCWLPESHTVLVVWLAFRV